MKTREPSTFHKAVENYRRASGLKRALDAGMLLLLPTTDNLRLADRWLAKATRDLRRAALGKPKKKKEAFEVICDCGYVLATHHSGGKIFRPCGGCGHTRCMPFRPGRWAVEFDEKTTVRVTSHKYHCPCGNVYWTAGQCSCAVCGLPQLRNVPNRLIRGRKVRDGSA